MRLVPALFAAAGLAAMAFADTPDAKPGPESEVTYLPGQEPGIYRFGATYSVQPADSASACQAACNGEPACFAWSHVEAAGDGHARCELKRGGGRASPNLLATSGISARHEALYAAADPDADLMGGPESAVELVAASAPTAPSSKPGPAPLTAPTDE
mgnify:CR=1 FL=1